jgi:formylglycine-generating enzyme required for sulfatase activity
MKEFRIACVRMTVVMLLAYLVLFVSSCAYDASFHDCAVACADDAGCPDGLACGSEGLCRTAGATAACSTMLGDGGGGSSFPSCAQLAATCGPNGDDDCCSTAMPIPGGTYYRSYDVGSDGMFPDMSYPATVSSFVLDKYEVTVGRFRRFVNVGTGTTQASPPLANAGARTLNGSASQAGWDSSWNASLTVDTDALVAAVNCQAAYATWTDSPGSNEALPMNCITWYEAFAFCIWDGGYLPTESEWNYAAAGGSEQRAYPWSNPASSLTIDCSYANYDPSSPCAGYFNNVGSESPKGDGMWGQSDLAGDVDEWILDWYGTYANPCIDCANLTPGSNADRMIRGGSIFDPVLVLRTAYRISSGPAARDTGTGVRCARP